MDDINGWETSFATRDVVAFFTVNVLTAEPTEAADRMLDANSESNTVTAVPFAVPADSIWELKDRITDLRSQINIVLKHVSGRRSPSRRRAIDILRSHLTNLIVGLL